MSIEKQMKAFTKMNICSFTFKSMTWCKITNKKKPNGLPTTAQRQAITPNKPFYNEDHNCVAIITGKQSGITVIDVDDEIKSLREELPITNSDTKIKKITKRLKLLEAFKDSGNHPDWMMKVTLLF